jgi:3-dehydroquinate dehydratase II
MKIAIIEGPLIDLIGSREPEYYGSFSRENMIKSLIVQAEEEGVELVFLNSYIEGELAKLIVNCDADGIIINPGAYTHTSILLKDALTYLGKPFIEAHFSNIMSRENFRKKSYISDISSGFIAGLGELTYKTALAALVSVLKK